MSIIRNNHILAAAFGAALLAGGLDAFAQNLPDGTYEEKNGIAYRKSATLLEDGKSYQIDLEAFVTGNVTVKQTAIPADIVLVLDVSGSMDYHLYGAPYTARSSANYSYSTLNTSTSTPVTNYFYKHTDGEYYPVCQESEPYYYYGYHYGDYYRLYFSVDGTKYYLTQTGTGRNTQNTITTTPPTNVDNTNSTIWSGVLYRGADLGTRISALKTAVSDFIDVIQHNDLYDEDNKRRVDADGNETALGNQLSIVKFAGNVYYRNGSTTQTANIVEGDNTYTSGGYTYNATQVVKGFTSTSSDANVEALKSAVNKLTARGGTAAHYGMNLARLLFESIKDTRTESSKTVVFFTDGVPGRSGWSQDYANSTIQNSYTIKSTYGATVFTVGVFSNLGSDEANVNTYMSYTSSQYPNAQSMTEGRTANSDGVKYYQSSSGANLSAIFRTIAQSSGGSGNTDVTSEAAVTVDVVSTSFAIPTNAGAENVSVLVAPCTGKQTISGKDYLTFGDAKEATQYGLPAITVELNQADNSVSTKGFDFSENWCGYDEKTSKYHGFKQIIRFTITVKEDAVGGPNVYTNEAGSGIYVNDTKVAEFNRPTVKIPVSIWIQKQGLVDDDSAVFTLARAKYVAGKTPSDDDYTSFTKVIVNKKTGTYMENSDGSYGYLVKITDLDPDYYYRIKEDAWAWTYDYQDWGVKYTVGEGVQNPFIFVNKPKDDTVKTAEATVHNTFTKKEK